MVGGDGADLYYVRDIGDVTTEANANPVTGGVDTVYTYLASHTLASNIENGRIVTAGVANLTGNTLNNLLFAGAGANALNGGSGTDTASYLYASAAITINLSITLSQSTGGSGTETLTNIENLTGSNYSDSLTGNASSNILNGGIGADTMLGGAGNDTYYVDNTGDKVYETTTATSGIDASGVDLVNSSLSTYTLGAFIENGRLTVASATNMTGNSLSNVIYVNAGTYVNAIDGSTGTDTLSYQYATTTGTTGISLNLGGTVDASGYVTTSGISGADKVKGIENITGSNYADTLTGNSGANVLNGLSGNDTMAGGAGNDTYVINVLTDVVTELTGGGTDTIQSAITYSLVDTDGAGANGGNVENLTLTGSSAINGTGNALANTLTGNSAANTLNGGAGNDVLYGGTGNDVLTGGTGSTSADTFVCNTSLSASTNKDTITDFETAYDTIKLENAIFAKLTATGTLSADFFNSYASTSTAAPVLANYGSDGADNYIQYNSATGALYYDADGSGTLSTAIQFAVIGTTTHASLTAADFLVT